MSSQPRHTDIDWSLVSDVAVVELRRPPHNYFDVSLLAGLADIYEFLERDGQCRAIVLASGGKAFCAGAKHSPSSSDKDGNAVSTVSREALRLFKVAIPVVAAVHGAAVGGGLGLALSADFRVTCASARFWANFNQLGLHAGFGLTATLPRLIGLQQATMLLYTGKRVGGEEAVSLGMADVLAEEDGVRAGAVSLANQIARSAPLAVRSMRHSLRRRMIEEVEVVMERELLEQTWQRQTLDFREGVLAMSERRSPKFVGR